MSYRKQKSKLKDQYYTDPEVAKDLIDYFDRKVGFNRFKIIVEPSAGNGSFFNNILRSRDRKVIGLDLHPKSSNIKRRNFLTWDMKELGRAEYDDVLCIGNPPFGRQGSLAKKFLNKCSDFSNHIAFILPVSFKSDAFKKLLPKGFRQEWVITLDDDIFVDPKGYIFEQPLKTMFVYYRYSDKKSVHKRKIKSNGLWTFQRKSTPQDRAKAHFRLIRVSGTPGRAVARNDSRFKLQGKTFNDFYIKLNPEISKYYKDIVADINAYQRAGKWKFNNTTTFKSIDKQQASKVLNKITYKYGK